MTALASEKTMQNKITAQYFSQGDFSLRAEDILERVSHETGFKAEQEIFRGFIYDRDKVGSLIYRGVWQGKPAVLKLQGLKPELDEGTILKAFAAQNASRLVRLPELYIRAPWSDELGCMYLVSEYVDAPHIFEAPVATAEEMADFCRFYQEYRTNCVRRPWIEALEHGALEFTLSRMWHWMKICSHKGRIGSAIVAPRCSRFAAVAETCLRDEHLVFSHGHLTADDIFKPQGGGYVLLSNLFWGWRLPWYDLAFNLWSCNLRLRDTSLDFAEFIKMQDAWRDAYRGIPVVRDDPGFERRFALVMLERTLGAILADLGAGDFFGRPENAAHLEHLLKLHLRYFDHLADKLA